MEKRNILHWYAGASGTHRLSHRSSAQPSHPTDQDGCRLTFRAPSDDLDFASPHFPGGSLINALYDRDLMRLSDRGGASAMIGSRWANLCSIALERGAQRTIVPVQPETDPLRFDRVIRLDDVPAISAQASRLKLQNPDFLLISDDDQVQRVFAADAKFSVDTAKSRQVSSDAVTSLIAMGPAIERLVPNLRPDALIEDGIFLCPDYSLTRRLLRTRRGLQRVTVADDEVRLISVDAESFLDTLGHGSLIDLLASLDDLPLDHHGSLSLSLFYFRLARALIGCWIDRTNPLLLYNDLPVVDLNIVEDTLRTDVSRETDAWRLMLYWNEIAEQLRRQRSAIDHVTALPISGKDLRARIDVAAKAAGVEPPSTNRVRRALGAWFRERYRVQFGPVPPPVDDFDALLARLAAFGRSLRPGLEAKAEEVILDFVSAPVAADHPALPAVIQ